MSPEAINKRQYSPKSDVYSFGITIWEIITVLDPFENMSAVEAAIEITTKNLRPTIPQGTSDILVSLLNRNSLHLTLLNSLLLILFFTGCWQTDPEQRPTMREVVSILGANKEDLQIPLIFPFEDSVSSTLPNNGDSSPRENRVPTDNYSAATKDTDKTNNYDALFQ